MSALREKIFEREGKGILKPQNTDSRPIEIPVKFTCAQYRDGVIDGTIEITEELYSPYLKYFFTTPATNFYINAENLNGEELNIDSLYITHTTVDSSLIDISFVTSHIKIKHKEISSASNKIWCKFDVSNLKSSRTFFDIEEGKVTVANYETSKEIWKEIENYKKSCVTGAIRIELSDAVRQQPIEEYKSLLLKKINKILLLASLSQGTYIDWASFELCEQNDEGEIEGFYSERKSIRSAFSARHELTPYFDLSNYFRKTYFNYTDNLDTKIGFDIAVEWYLESLGYGVLEGKYLRACICLELLKDRYNKLIDNESIIPKDQFKEKCYPDLKEKTREVLKEIGINKEKRGEVYANLNGIYRTSFKSSLLRLLDDVNIIYDDLFPDVDIIITIRDQITHRGVQELKWNALFDVYQRLTCLIQRIFLALLKYEGRFYQKNKYEQSFTNFIKGGFSQIP